MKKPNPAQINLLDEIIIDNFAGGGGASTGIEMALGRPVTVAINHDPAAILMHKTNHPYTQHLQDSVWNIDPVKICAGRPVGLAWFSPDCKHFSKAKGAALVDKNIRGLAWIVLKWAGTVKPRVIILENVEEFKTWGPVHKGKPVKKKQGQTFDKWFEQLKALGYEIEYRELVAADYGAPTTRKRFVLIARCDGKPIVWPKRTHASIDSEEVKSGKCKPWVSAAEIIDWSLPCPSIFETSQQIKDKYGVKALRPLKPNTLRRISRGIDKFVIKSQKPFIIPVGYGEKQGQKPRVNDIAEPLGTVVSTVKHNVVDPILTPYGIQVNHGDAERINSLDDKPMNTITAKNGYGVSEPILTPYALNQKFNNTPEDINKPLSAITAVNSKEIVQPVLAPFHMHNHSNAAGTDIKDPVNTVTGTGSQMLITPHLSKYFGGVVGENVKNPMPTVTAIDHNALVAPSLIQYHTEQSDKENRAYNFDGPIKTIDSSARYGIAAAHLTQYFKGDHYHGPTEPLHTVTTEIREGVTLGYLTEYYGNARDGIDVNEPLKTITTKDREGVTLAHITEFKGQDIGQGANDPLRTITTSAGEFGAVYTRLEKVTDNVDLKYWPQVREKLNVYCDYWIADDEILILTINGIDYFISDIGLRMLTPKELYAAQGFPKDYIIENDYKGNAYPKAQQVARCGNAVCPPLATAVVKANLPEYCCFDIQSMSQLTKIITV